MTEVKKCIKSLLIYFLLLAFNILPETGIILLRFPTYRLSTIYLLLLSVCLILRFYLIVSERKKVKNMMMHIAGMIFLLLLFRSFKYTVFGNVSALGRFCWYLYYVPMLIIPMLLFLTALYIYAGDEKKVGKIRNLLFAAAGAFVLLVLTNDFHQFVFRFQPGFERWDEIYSHETGFVLISVWQYLLYTAAVAVLVIRYSVSGIKRRSWLILVPFASGISALLLLIFGNMPKINGHNILELPEILCFMVASVLECCIQLGLIPTNESYGKLFQISGISAQITNRSGERIYGSAAASVLTKEQFELPDGTRIGEHILLRRMEVSGGYGFWQEDMTELDDLNEELADAKERLSEEAELIRLQNELEQKKSVIEQRSFVYDTIAKRTQRQSQQISRLADEAEGSSDGILIERNRRHIILLGAYIKRYANLTLLAADNRVIEAGELALSFSEVLRYLHSFGVFVEAVDRAEGSVSADAALAVFEAFQTVIEENLFLLKGVTANFSDRTDGITCRLTLEGLRNDLTEEEKRKLSLAGVGTASQCEDEITYLSFFLPEGGGEV